VRLLLDTCCLLWALQDFKRISSSAQQDIKNPRNEVCVSLISFWEISIKASLGKLQILGANPEDFPHLVNEAGWEIVPLDAETVATSGRLPFQSKHRDPFDRLMVWCAIREDFVLVSRDRAMEIYAPNGLRICW